MPQEPDVYPADLLAADSEDAMQQWWALYTLSRREKDLSRRLRKMEIAYYAPMVKRRTRSPAGRVRESFVPLFSGYVFVTCDDEQRQQVLTTNCVSRCLEIPDSLQLLRDLRQVQRLVQLDAPLTPEARIVPGARVRVRSGPFMGLEGTVQQRRGQQRLVVAVEFLQQGASVLIEDYQLENIS
ncbi:MAG: hypothetical protein N2C12_11680 [Planctomycetales bacterium]